MGIGGVAVSLLSARATNDALAQVSIAALKREGGIDTSFGQWALQYWPSSIAISNGVEYAQRNVIGGSHPLYQFISKSERVVSFTAEFSRDLNGDVIGGGGLVTPAGKVRRDKYNVDIAQAIVWLESMMAVQYGANNGGGFDPPPTLLVVVPNSKIGRSRGGGVPTDYIQSIMVTCNPTIDAWFPDGTIRHATVDLGFAETVQTASGIQWADRANMVGSKVGGKAYGVGVARK